jgi:hypothetical protein
MLRRSLVVLTVAAVIGSASADLNACGDKFLRAGRSAKNKGYASVFPSSILVYTPHATDKGMKAMETFLKKAGHKPVCLKKDAELTQALTAAKYDLVIADYANTSGLKDRFGSLSIDPGLLPMLNKPTKIEEADARKQFKHLIKLEDMTIYDALEQIDEVMKLRRKGIVTSAAK